jgi:phosphoglycolate phosphatase-like HAD superfamily hydrolase
MTGTRRYDEARSISLDFDGVLSTLILGRPWIKTRARTSRYPFLSPLVQTLKRVLGVLTQRWRSPFPHAEGLLRDLRDSRKTLSVLTSRTGGSVAEAHRWLDKYGWRDFFDALYFNVDGEDADAFKARILGSRPIDIHIDDDAETLAYLSARFPDKLFVHMNCYDRKSLSAANVITVGSWGELPSLFFPDRAGSGGSPSE